ncbi:MAG TPA: YbaN family protein [Bacteriovoracaceae bacterium]|nr:YbaN family protein [Bacteriovoracaceae bacterium]
MKPVLFIFAWFFFGLGVIGAFLPVLPTTPFLLLSAYLFSKSSPKFHAWLLELPLAGAALEDWNKRRVIRTKAKILCSSMIIGSLIYIWLGVPIHVAIKSLVTLILVSVMIFVNLQKSR